MTIRTVAWPALVLIGCAAGGDEAVPVSVAAASSLTDALAAIEPAFETDHPDIDLRLSFAGSQVLRLQIERGAPVDVFVSANEEHVRALVETEVMVDAGELANNALTVVVPAAATHPAAFADLVHVDRLVIGTAEVPVGRYTRALFDRAASAYGPDFAARLRAKVVSEETNVRLVRAKVALGEADAAIVYRTDARSPRVREIAIPREINVAATYRLVRRPRGPHAAAAGRFARWLQSERGGRILRTFGFETARR